MSDAAASSDVRSAGRREVPFQQWSWVLVLVVGAALYGLTWMVLSVTGNPLFVPALIFLGAAVIPVAFVDFMAGRHLPFSVGTRTVGLTALVGGVIGALVAGLLEFEVVQSEGGITTIAVGLIEEFAKLLAPAAVLLFTVRGRRAADGLLLGVACGAGFAVLETMGDAMVALIRSGGDLALVQGVLFERGLLSPSAHMAWTGLTAAALFAAAAERWRARAVARFVVVFLVVVALHATWDSAISGWAHAVLVVASLGLLVLTDRRIAAADRRRHSQQWPPSAGGLVPGQRGESERGGAPPVFPAGVLPREAPDDRSSGPFRFGG